MFRTPIATLAALLGITAVVACAALWMTAGDDRTDQAGPPFIAVLPFEPGSEGESSGLAADLLSEELIGRLAAANGLRVAARSSSMRISPRSASLPPVRYLLAGSVSLEPEALRVNARLLEGDGNTTLWAATYDRENTELMPIAAEIAGEVLDRLTGGQR